MVNNIVIKDGKKYKIVPYADKEHGGTRVNFLVPVTEKIMKPKIKKSQGNINYLRALTPEESEAFNKEIERKANLLAKNELKIMRFTNEYLDGKIEYAKTSSRKIHQIGEDLSECLVKKFTILGHNNPERVALLYFRSLGEYRLWKSENITSEKLLKEHFKSLMLNY